MSAKKTATPRSRSVRYLLSADRRLKKLSLRKLSDHLKKTKARPAAAAKTTVAAKTATGSRPPESPIPPPPKAYSWRAIVVGMTCVLAAAALMTARQADTEGDGASGAAPRRASTAPSAMSVAASKPAAKTAPKPAAASTANTASPRTPIADATPAATTALAGQPSLPPVTITGCLERDEDTFWLKNASGDVPTSRSWKTGFLRKRSPRIELVGGPGAGALSAHVGQRVAASGTLVDHELRANSVRRVAVTCD